MTDAKPVKSLRPSRERCRVRSSGARTNEHEHEYPYEDEYRAALSEARIDLSPTPGLMSTKLSDKTPAPVIQSQSVLGRAPGARYAILRVDVERIGNYRITGPRGRDATGLVFEARHIVLPRRAIVKVMEASEPRPIAVQLLREACILEALEHPGIVRVYESGLLADRRPWFAHECVEGATIANLLEAGPLDPQHAVVMLRDIAEVLEHVHRRGIVHCGLRPDRIVITGRSRGYPLCIVDWSDARVHDTTSPHPEPQIADYSAPELMHGGPIDDRADVFSLGVIAYQALTGELPFDGVWLATVADGSTQHVPTEVRCPDAPPELTAIVDQMLSWDRFDRPSSAEANAELAQLALDLAEPPVPRLPGAVRIRRPRWTPALPMGEGEPDLIALDTSAVSEDDNTGSSS